MIRASKFPWSSSSALSTALRMAGMSPRLWQAIASAPQIEAFASPAAVICSKWRRAAAASPACNAARPALLSSCTSIGDADMGVDIIAGIADLPS